MEKYYTVMRLKQLSLFLYINWIASKKSGYPRSRQYVIVNYLSDEQNTESTNTTPSATCILIQFIHPTEREEYNRKYTKQNVKAEGISSDRISFPWPVTLFIRR